MTFRRWLTGGLAVCAMTASLWARPGTVTTRSGATYQGEITEAEDGKLIVKVRGIDMRIERRDVASVVFVDDEQADFQKKLVALPPRDAKSRLDMARSAFDKKQYDLSRQAAEAALVADPNSKEATDFLVMIRKQQEIERAPKPADHKPPTGNDPLLPDQPATPNTPAAPGGPVDRKTLSADDINVIKQFELGADENNIRATFNNDVRRRFTNKDGGGSLQDFMAEPVGRQVRLILTRAPEMRNDVRIVSDPASIQQFKKLQPSILGGCASSGCHGGANGGKFVLLTPGDGDAAAYTNFYILTQYAKQIEKSKEFMIDRTAPAKSLLLQYALPTDVADFPHPAVPGYKGMFRNANDPRFKAISEWLSGSLQPVSPDYGIKFTPPTATPATTAPAGK